MGRLTLSTGRSTWGSHTGHRHEGDIGNDIGPPRGHACASKFIAELVECSRVSGLWACHLPWISGASRSSRGRRDQQKVGCGRLRAASPIRRGLCDLHARSHGRIISWNTGAEQIKGYTASEIIGEHFSQFYTPEDREAKLPWRALETAGREGRYRAEGWRQRKDGSRFWASVVIDPIRDDDGALIGFAKVTRDMTELREAQLELEKSREQLFQSQKMEAVGQLTGGLAHDFNNLLTGIIGSLDMLRSRMAQGRISELDRYITAAQGAASRAAALTHRLLAFSRQQTLEPKAVDANKLVAGHGGAHSADRRPGGHG